MKSLNEIQENQKILLKGIEHPRLGNVIGLFEEVGELAKEVTDIEVYKEQKKGALGQECADVLFSLLSLCDSYGINLSSEYEAKVKEIERKIPDWRLKYTGILKALRSKLD